MVIFVPNKSDNLGYEIIIVKENSIHDQIVLIV